MRTVEASCCVSVTGGEWCSMHSCRFFSACAHSRTPKRLSVLTYISPAMVLIKEGSYGKCAAGLWSVWFWSRRRSFIMQNTITSIIHTVTKSRWLWPAGGYFSPAALSGSHCRVCHFWDELWGLRQHNGSNGAHFPPHTGITLRHNRRSL